MKKRLVYAALIIVILGTGYYLFTHDTSPTPLPQVNNTSDKPADTTTTQPTATGFDKTKYSKDDVTSIWVIVNKQRPLNPKDYAPNDLTAVGGGQQLRKDAASALSNLIAAAKTENLGVQPLSGYRSYNTQVSVYNNEVATNGQAVADTQSARPGTSEHQTGLSIDVGGGGCGIEDCFGTTAEGKWVAANAYKYGFIVRYQAGKETITGYRAEPWHIRYVGVELATEMHTQNVATLEEFFNILPSPAYSL